jgi:hypothetical protein
MQNELKDNYFNQRNINLNETDGGGGSGGDEQRVSFEARETPLIREEAE